MKNQEVANLLYEIADILEIRNVPFKPYAYRKAARNIESLNVPIEEVWLKGELYKIPGIGSGIGKKIEEYLKTGKLKYYEKLKKSIPIDLEEFNKIPGLGPKTAIKLFKKLGIKNLKELKKAAEEGKIRKLEGFGEKSEKKILEGIKIAKDVGKRHLLGYILPIAEELINKLKPLSNKISLAGSIRRGKETIGDIDILATSNNPKNLINFFSKQGKILVKGPTKCSILLNNMIQVDLRVLSEDKWGSALQYFTGSKEHNIHIRKIAIKKGFKLSEYGLFDKNNKLIASKTEEDIYKKLGMDCPPPEIRRDKGEIEAALKYKLPKLIKLSDIKGDLHIHSNYSDGVKSIEEIIKAAINRNYEYIAITDHYGNLKIAKSMNKRQLKKQVKEIDNLQKKYPQIKILKGIEANILPDGKIDNYDKELFRELDFVIASVHSRFKGDQTNRLINAINNEFVKIIGHPTGRKIFKREPMLMDFDKIIDECKKNKVALEINSFPERLDLNDEYSRRAKEKAKLVINTDAHNTNHLNFIKFGVITARRGWVEKNNVINTLKTKKLLKFLNK